MRREVRYSCWLGALVYAAGALLFAGFAVGTAVALVLGRGDVDPVGIVLCTALAVGLGFLSWWAGCEVTVEGGYVAWRSLLRRRWIRLDRLTYVTAPGWFGATMTLDTDDGGRLHVLVPGGYRGQARAFAANFAGPPSSRRLAERLPMTEGPPDTSDATPPDTPT